MFCSASIRDFEAVAWHPEPRFVGFEVGGQRNSCVHSRCFRAVSDRQAARFSRLKILQISSAQTLGGGERHLADLAHGLAARGHELHVALRPDSPLIEELKNLPKGGLEKLPLRNSLDVRSAHALAGLVHQHQIQIVHAHMARDYPLAAYAVWKNRTSRLILTRHVLFQMTRLHRVTFHKAARVIAVSQAVAHQLSTSRVVPPEKIRLVLNGVKTNELREARVRFNRVDFFREWELPLDTLLVGIVGELTPLKGQAEFLKAAEQVLKEQPNAFFIIAGTDSSRDSKNRRVLEQLIADLKLSSNVRIVDWLEDIAQLYCAVDVFVSASHTESFGLAIAEAMASGTAVVATATDGAKELIEPEVTGLLTPINDPTKLAEGILSLLNNREKRIAIGTAAQKAVAVKADTKRMIDETEGIYQEVISQTSSVLA